MLLDAVYLLSNWQYLHFHQPCITVLFSLHPHQRFILLDLLIFPNLMGEKLYLTFLFTALVDI